MTRFSAAAGFIGFALLVSGCGNGASDPEGNESRALDTTIVDFWSGNRSEARQVYERQVLEAALEATGDEYGAWRIVETMDEYPGDQEALAFTEEGHDLFVTIAGNQKFEDDDMIVIAQPIARNLLGYRIAIIRDEDAARFNAVESIEQARQLDHGIPETWSDAIIFRHNGFRVSEEGNFDDIFDRLAAGRFDYSAFGVNEVLGVYENRASRREGLVIDDGLLFFYPFPLVFYINPERPGLAERMERGLQAIEASGELDAIFERHYGNIANELGLSKRRLFVLDNPLIPERFRDLSPDPDWLGQ